MSIRKMEIEDLRKVVELEHTLFYLLGMKKILVMN